MAKQSKGSKVLDADLLWLYGGDAEAELGKHGAALEPSVRGEVDPSPSPSALAAAFRARRLYAALHSLPHAAQQLIKLAHQPVPPALQVAHALVGALAAVVRSRVAPADVDAALRAARLSGAQHREARDAAKALVARWVASASSSVADAVCAFRAELADQDRSRRDVRRARSESRARERFEQRWAEEQARVFGRAS